MDYKLEDLIDIPLIQNLQDKLNKLNSFTTSIIDNDGKILTAVGSHDICTKFHQTNPECEKECIESDKYIMGHLHEANPAVSYQCPHGLIDSATPIIIDGKHLGNFFTGQFFLEKPDLEFFKLQAKKYGFDEKSYLETVEKVPIWTKEKLNQYIDFIKGFIEMIASMGLKNLKQIETNKALQESEKNFEAAFNSNPIPLSITTFPEGKIVAVNNAYCDFYGYTPEDLLNSSTKQSGIWRNNADRIYALHEILSNGKLKLFETNVNLASGEIKTVLCSTENIIWKGQECLISSITDITDRKNIERQLNESKEKAEETAQRLQLALFSGQFGIWDWNVKDNIMIWDDKMFEFYGVCSDNCPKTVDQWINGLHPEDKQRAIDECNAALKGEKEFNTTFRVIHPDGEVLYLKANGLVIRDEDNKPIRMLGMNKDVSKQERTKIELIKAKEKAEESNRLKTAFLRNISHEVRTPLNAIVGFSSIMAEKNYDDKKLKDYAKIINNSSDKLIGIMMDVIEISQIQSSQVEVNLAEIRLQPIINNVLDQFYDKPKNADVEFICRLKKVDEETKVISDEMKLQKILFHLLDNAFKFTENGSITIQIELLNENLKILVSDTGIGIGKEHQDHIFEPFRQIEQETYKSYDGLGLGLALVKSYVEILQGHLFFKSEPARGTEVIVEIPAKEIKHKQNVKQEQIIASLEKKDTRPVILVAEDDLNSFLFLKEVLESENIIVLHACNGQIAVDMCRSNAEIRLTLMDFKMPVMDGFTAAKQIKKFRPALPIVAQTAYTDSINEKGMDCFDEYLSKPVRVNKLKSLVFEYLK